MLWSALLLVAVWIGVREKWVLPRWLMAFIFALYASVTLGAEAWYPPLFVPFGYLLLAAIGWHIWQKANFEAGRGTRGQGTKCGQNHPAWVGFGLVGLSGKRGFAPCRCCAQNPPTS
jgi:hypothetical protein